jgi:putative drug exporter of the RND superfamily
MLLEKIGRAAARRHWLVIGLWLAVALVVGSQAGRLGGKPVDSFTIPGTGSQQALDILEQRFPSAATASATVVFFGAGDLRSGAPASAIDATVAELAKISGVASASNPLSALPPELAALVPPAVATDGSVAYSTVQFTEPVASLPPGAFAALEEAVRSATDAGVRVAFSGPVVDLQDTTAVDGGLSEHADEIGLGFAVVILMVSMGSVMAMAVPIGSALIGLAVSASLLVVAMDRFTIGTAAPAIGTMIGLGVGIDYALFIVSRHRQNLADGDEPIASAARATALAGSAVLFAGITVCLALAGLALVGIPYVATLGFAAAMYVAVAIIAALTLIPALLGLLGPRINALRIHRHDEGDGSGTYSERWAAMVSARPLPFALGGLAILVLLTVPVLRMELAFPSAADDPPDQTQRVAYDQMASGFGPGENGPLLVVLALPEPSSANVGPELTATVKLVEAVNATPGVARTVGPIPNEQGTAAIITVTPTTGPDDPGTAELVRRLRADTIPTALAGTTIDTSQVAVGGETAELIDLSDLISQRLPWFIGSVVLAAFLLLMMVFRSVLVPLKAAVLNLLSIGAAYGVIVAVFQWGWARELVALEQTVPVAPFIPVMMFAILFGLSMDYEVFLLSRIREEWSATGDAAKAVVNGLARTARVITSAALIMISVFLAFVTNPSPVIKMIGFGMAVAVFVDATVVRMVVVPAVMRLFGERAWWLPHWLDRILPHINVDGAPSNTTRPDGAGPDATGPSSRGPIPTDPASGPASQSPASQSPASQGPASQGPASGPASTDLPADEPDASDPVVVRR